MVPAQSLITTILTGPTASGKSSVAMELARSRGDIEIINADSIQVYKHFDIGSAKPSEKELNEIPHHLIGVIEPENKFTAGDFVKEVTRLVTDIRSRKKIPLIVGGTGFYLKALLYGMWDAPPAQPLVREQLDPFNNEALYKKLETLDPKAAEKISINDRYRLIRALEIIESTGKLPSDLEKLTNSKPNPEFRLLIIDRESSELEPRIESRSKEMIERGFIKEVKEIMTRYPDASALKSVGYAQVVDYLNDKKPSGRKIADGDQGLITEISLATRQLVKRQRTWFRGQTEGEWFILNADLEQLKEKLETIE